MMHWFLQGEMCSERDVFLSFISSAVFCSRRGLWQTSSHFCHCFAIATAKLLLLAADLGDWAIDACVQTVMDSLLCKLPHPINATSVHQQRATISSPFLQAEDTLTVVTRIVKYFGFSRQLWVAWCAIWHKTCLFACIVLDVIWKNSKRSNKKVWYVIWKSSKRCSKHTEYYKRKDQEGVNIDVFTPPPPHPREKYNNQQNLHDYTRGFPPAGKNITQHCKHEALVASLSQKKIKACYCFIFFPCKGCPAHGSWVPS